MGWLWREPERIEARRGRGGTIDGICDLGAVSGALQRRHVTFLAAQRAGLRDGNVSVEAKSFVQRSGMHVLQ